MSTDDHKRKYDEIADNTGIEENVDDNPGALKRQKLDHKPWPDEHLDSIRALPTEIRYQIFSYLNWIDAFRSQVVCSLWHQEVLNALEVLNLRAPELTDLRKTSWLLKQCANIRSFTQYEGRSQGFDLLPLKHLPHLKSLHLRVCESSSASIMQIITKHLTGLVALTCPENVDDIEFRNLCKEFSQRQLTRLTVGSATLTNSGLQYISLLTSLKDFSVKNSFLIHDAISSATTNLRRLKIECCSRLKGMNLANFPNLESLVVSKSSGFQLTNARLCTNLTRLKPRYQFGLEEWPIMEMTQLESLEISGSTTQIAKLSLLQNLTKLDLLDQSTSVMPDLVNCTQLKSLQITSALGLSTQMELLLSLPNLENLSLIGLRVEKPTCLSSLQRLKVLKIECPNCTAHLDALYLARPCNEIRGIEKLTNLEVLSLKACTHPNLSNLTRLKSLSFRVNCFSQSQPTTVFIYHVAKVPYLALQKFQISGIASKVIQASIVHLIAQQTSLQELTVGTRDKSVNGHNYHTKQLMHFKQLMARPQSDEDDEDESSVSYD